MTFAERLTNFVSSFAEAVLSAVSDTPADLIDDYRLRYGYFRSFDELAAQSLLWLFTRDHILDYPRPTMPHFINVGGLTVRRPIGNLPTDLASFVGEATRGFLVVSFGSLAPTLPEVIIRKLFDAFRRLDDDGYRFVVRLADAKGIDVPQNVMLLSWIPQNDLLAHGSVKGFVTHCGNCGQYEGVYHSVPMIGFPLFVDQHYNARRMQHKGYGITMNIHTFTSEQLVNNVRSLANNQSYTDAVTKLSRLLRDSPESPAERAAFWIEHVCRHGGEHLRSSGQDLPVYAYVMIDVLMFVLLTAGCGVCCLWKTAHCSWRLLNKKTGRKQNLKEKIN